MADFLTGLITGIGVNLSEVDKQNNYNLMVSLTMVNMVCKQSKESLLVIPGYLLGSIATRTIKFINQEAETDEMIQKQKEAKDALIGISYVGLVLGVPALVMIMKKKIDI